MINQQITELTKQHNRSGFDCGSEALNTYLKQSAKQQAGKEITRTFVLFDINEPTEIMGFFTLSLCSVKPHLDCPARRYPHDLSAVKIARFAVDKRYHRKGVGSYLLMAALRKSLDIHLISPLMGVVLDAKDQRAKDFYASFGFTVMGVDHESETSKMIILMKPIRDALEATG
jgi:GNAT superfamily N-acetyltransferase